MRSGVMVLVLAVAYGLLRGYPEGLPSVVRVCVAVLVLVAGLGFWGKRRGGAGELAVSRRSAGWLDYVAIGVTVLALECLFLLFFSAAPERLEGVAERLEAWLAPAAALERDKQQQANQDGRKGNWLWDREQRRPLPRRTNYKPGNRPEVFLQPKTEADSDSLLRSRIYVHGFALSRFDEGAWSAFPGLRRRVQAGNDGWVRLAEGGVGEALSCRVFHGAERGGQNPVTGLQGLVAVNLAEVVELDDGLHLLPQADQDDLGYEYDTISRPWTLDDLRGKELRVPREVPEEWLQLPRGILGSRIGHLTRVITDEGEVAENLARIRTHLRTALEYSLVTENKDDRDPLENFLFYEQRGHCEFFATAGALMARASGVPSRVAYGWSGGTYYEGSRLFVFRAREAHAWAEVWLEDYGWVVLDPTPPSALTRSLAEVAGADEKPPGTEELEIEEEAGELAQLPLWKVGLGLVLIFAVTGVLLLLWRGGRNRGSGCGLAGDLAATGEEGYLVGFVKGCRKRGARVRPGTTLKCLVEGLAERPDFGDEMVTYHYRVRYEGHRREPRVEKELKKRVVGWDGG